MKRITRLSTVAILSLSSMVTFANASENLADAFTNGKIKGQIKSVYSNSNFLGNVKSDDITTIGGSLGFITDDFYGFNAGATFQTSHVLNQDNNNNVFSSDLDAQGSVLSEAYVSYKLANTSAKMGRQFIYTPLVSSAIDGKASESLIKDSFEAYVLTNTDIPDTTLMGSYIDKYQAKATSGDIGSFEQFEDGAYTFYAKNTSIKDLTLQAQYLKVNAIATDSDIQNLYFQADYMLAGHTLSAQYLSSTDESKASNLEDAELFGLKATGPVGLGKLGYVVAYNSSTKDGEVNLGKGSGTTDTPFTAMPVNGGGVPSRADTDTIVGGLIVPIYDVTFVGYAGKSFSKTHVLGDVTATGAMVIYPFYKNFLLKANYEHVEVEKVVTENTDVSRIYLSYSF